MERPRSDHARMLGRPEMPGFRALARRISVRICRRDDEETFAVLGATIGACQAGISRRRSRARCDPTGDLDAPSDSPRCEKLGVRPVASARSCWGRPMCFFRRRRVRLDPEHAPTLSNRRHVHPGACGHGLRCMCTGVQRVSNGHLHAVHAVLGLVAWSQRHFVAKRR